MGRSSHQYGGAISVNDSSTGHIKVLVIDDSNTIRRSAEIFLRQAGYEVFLAEDGFDALAKISDHQPQIIFVDIMMPRLDGYQTCALIKQNPTLKSIPVIMLSSKDGVFDRARGRLAGSDRYLTKPWTGEQLLKHFDAALAQADRARGEQVLDEALLEQACRPGAATLELLDLEAAEPGITRVARGPMVEVVLPSQLMTLPGDLWTPEAARDAGPRWRSF